MCGKATVWFRGQSVEIAVERTEYGGQIYSWSFNRLSPGEEAELKLTADEHADIEQQLDEWLPPAAEEQNDMFVATETRR